MTSDTGNRPVICIVDDDNAVLAALGVLAESQGWEVRLFDSARAYLEALNKVNGHAACLVLDLQMPNMNGAELLEHLDTKGRQVPTIVLTAWPEGSMAARALAAGAEQVISKPCDPVQWLQEVRSVIDR